MDYRKAAQTICERIGGKENLVSAAHCATRLRLVVADDSKVDSKAIEAVEGVKGVFAAQGQLQVVFGTGVVNKVFEEFSALTGIAEASKDETKQAATASLSLPKRAVKTLGDVFVPIIPAIVASGLMMGLLEGLGKVYPELADSGTYTLLSLFSNAAFVFLPVLIAVSAARAFGGNLFLGAVIGMILIHPNLLNAWSVASAQSVPSADVWFGLYRIPLVGYQGHVIPVVISVWVMSWIEKRLHRIVPEMIDLFITPLVTVLTSAYLALTVIGPVFSFLENYVLLAAQWLITIPLGIGAALVGAVYAPTVVAGVHHMYNALEAGLLSSTGLNIWMPIATAANVGQGAAALAVALRTRNTKLRGLALPASLSAFLGITEPAIFGVNLRYVKPFLAGCAGGVAGGLVAGIAKVGATAYGVTGVFGMLITTHQSVSYLLVMAVSAVTAFAVSWMLFRDPLEGAATAPAEEPLAPAVEKEPERKAPALYEPHTVYSPLEGEAIPLSAMNDPTFAQEVLGKGFGVIPSLGKVYAPFGGKVSALFPTDHAIGLTSPEGIELLIHVGINTVKLGGKHFSAHVAQDDTVAAGQLLLEFDIPAIQGEGYDIASAVIVTNSDAYASIAVERMGAVRAMEKMIVL